MPSEPVTGFDDGVNEQAIVDEFLNALPHCMARYSRSCLVFNPVTGRYEAPGENGTGEACCVTSEEEDPTPIATHPAPGQLAPPPTPATISPSLENGNGSLEPISEGDSLDLAAASRPASPEKGSKETCLDKDIEETVADGTGLTEAAESESDEPATSETRVITPITATISIIDSLSAKNGNQGLEASKFAKPGFVPRVSNSSRPRNTALAPRDPNAGSGNIEVTKSSAPETRKSSDSYQNRVVEQFRKEHEETKMEGRFVKFEKAEGSPAPEKAAAVKNTVDTTGAPAEIVTATMNTPLPAISVNAPADTSTAASGQDRLEATYFASWGAPEARSGPKAEIRRVLLKSLPAGADNAFVAALVHGGALESYRLAKISDSAITTAVFTFTTGAAAKAYYDKYPNGLDIKFQGKKYVAMVNLGENVDVISGVLRGYLESGATRVVRAVGADEDWAMRALRKIAEDKGRKVESIVDTFKDEGRTIEFRFTNIADAVAFRGSLMRDPEWADCTLQFGEDPCEKATGVRKI